MKAKAKSRPVAAKRQVSAARDEIKIGVRLKHARLARGLKLRELADTLSCSESFLSKLENDRVRPSLAMLHKLVGTLGINIPSLFSQNVEEVSPVQIGKKGQRPVLQTGPLARGPGISLERLIAVQRASLLEANIHCVAAGGHTDGLYNHEGEELGYVLQGQLELEVDGVVYLFEEGDSFFFRSDLPHGYRNRGSKMTKILWVNTPPTF